jgi:hypothetical protein
MLVSRTTDQRYQEEGVSGECVGVQAPMDRIYMSVDTGPIRQSQGKIPEQQHLGDHQS